MRVRLFLFLLCSVTSVALLHAADLSRYQLVPTSTPLSFLAAYPFVTPPLFTLSLANHADTREGVNEVLPVNGKTKNATFQLILKKFNGSNSCDRETRSTLTSHAKEMAHREYTFMNALFQQSPRHFIEPMGIYSERTHWALLMHKGPTSLHSKLFPIQRDISKMQPFSLPKALSIAEGLAEGLKYMQNLGLVHGDIKPANILLPEDPSSPSLFIDFGYMFHPEQEPEKTAIFCGSPYYMAPEIHRIYKEKRSKRGVEVDYFAMGCILHELLHGQCYTISLLLQNPHYSSHRIGTITLPLLNSYMVTPDHFQKDHRQKAATSLSDYDQLISDLTHFDPLQRLHDADALLTRIQDMRRALLHQEPVEAEIDMTESCYEPGLEKSMLQFSYEEITLEEMRQAEAESQGQDTELGFTMVTKSEAKQTAESVHAGESWGKWLANSVLGWQ